MAIDAIKHVYSLPHICIHFVKFLAKRDVVLDSQLPKGMSGDRLRTLEEGPKMGEPMSPEAEAEPPRFVKEVSQQRQEEQ